MRAIDEVRDALKEQAQKDINEYASEPAIAHGCEKFPAIMMRSEAIKSLREVLMRELTQSADKGKGFVFEGFKGVNNMTNKELSGNQHQYLGPAELDEMGLW